MSGNFATKLLANGQLAASTGTLYTVPSSTTTIIKSILLVNTDTSTRTVNLFVSSGTNRRIIPKDLSLKAGESYIFDEVLTLEATHTVKGDASSATVVDYTIFGVEET